MNKVYGMQCLCVFIFIFRSLSEIDSKNIIILCKNDCLKKNTQ